uniref:Uncharacterized protein n=1 Tax=Anguilla anguilla TaxID=7936 RepID=A0A0E9UQZ7_ANGAN
MLRFSFLCSCSNISHNFMTKDRLKALAFNSSGNLK